MYKSAYVHYITEWYFCIPNFKDFLLFEVFLLRLLIFQSHYQLMLLYQGGHRYQQNYLNKEEDVRMWNHEHHSDYNNSCKKKKMKEYIVGKPYLDVWSFDHLNTHF